MKKYRTGEVPKLGDVVRDDDGIQLSVVKWHDGLGVCDESLSWAEFPESFDLVKRKKK